MKPVGFPSLEAQTISCNDLLTAYVMNMGANGLAVARTLGRQGVPVVGVDSRPKAPGLASSFVKGLVTEDLQEDPGSVLSALISAAEGHERKGVIFPASDAAVLFLSKHEKELSERFLFTTPPGRVREAMVNKRQQYEEAVRLGIPVPDTCFPAGPEDLKAVGESVRFPAFIKPLYSHQWCNTFPNKGFIVSDQADLRNKMAMVFESGHEVMVQTIMSPPGEDLYSVGAYFGGDGYVSPDFCWHKLRQYPPSFGVGSLVESAHQPEVRELALRFMKGMEYRGIGYVEFKLDRHDGRYKMVEMNARTGQTNALQEAAGVPLVLFQYYDLIGHPFPETAEYRDGIVWWDSLSDIESYWRLSRRGQLNSFDWIRSVSKVDVHAYFDLTDPVPFLRRYGYGGELAKMTYNLLKMKTDEDAMPRAVGETGPERTNGPKPAVMDDARDRNRRVL